MPQNGEKFRRLVTLFRHVCALGEQSYEAARFSAEASEILQQHACVELVCQIIDWIAEVHELPVQRDVVGAFGDPPITILNSGDVSIELLFWRLGRTAIHDHSFSGAFCVLTGHSLHCSYDWILNKEIEGNRLEVGDLNLIRHESLNEMSVRRIDPGKSGIHALFHLEAPAITMVIRRNEKSFAPQLTYLRPNVAIDVHCSLEVSRKCEIMMTLEDDRESCRRFLVQCCRNAGAYDVFRYLLCVSNVLTRGELRELCRSHFGDYGENAIGSLQRTLVASLAVPRLLSKIKSEVTLKGRLDLAMALLVDSVES